MELDEQQVRIGARWRRHRVGSFANPVAFHWFADAYRAAWAAVPPPVRTHRLSLPAGTVAVYEYGPAEGEAVLLLPGRHGSTPLWGEVLERLAAAGKRVLAIDMVGEPGASIQDVPLYSADAQTTVPDGVLEQLRVDHALVTGIGLGGWLAAWTAIRRPARVTGVVLIDPAAVFAPLPMDLRTVAMGAIVPGLSTLRRRERLRRLSGFSPPDGPLGHLLDAGIDCFTTRFAAPEPVPPAALAATGLPTLTVLTDPGRMGDPAVIRSAASALPGVSVVDTTDVAGAITAFGPR